MTNTQPDRLIRAPWTSEQVQALNTFQQHGGMHPFTCGALHPSGQSPVLDATHAGWICPDPDCEYTQDWAWRFMAAEPDDTDLTEDDIDRMMAAGTPAQIITALPATFAAVSVPVPAPTGRTALRDRIAAALEREDAHNAGYDHGFCGSYGADEETDGFVDAVLAAVLPARDDRATILREAADDLGRMDYDIDSNDYGYDTYRDAWNGGVMDAAALLRRRAAAVCGPHDTDDTTGHADTQADDEALRAKVDEATTTLRRVRSKLRELKDQGATGWTYYQVITEALAGPRPDTAPDPETEEQIVREHVTTVHLIGEQLADVESWLWKRLAEVRAEQPAVVAQPDEEA